MAWFTEEKGIQEFGVKNFLVKLTDDKSLIELFVLGYWIWESLKELQRKVVVWAI